MEGGKAVHENSSRRHPMNRLTHYEPLVGTLDGLFNEFFRPAFVLDQRGETAPIRVDVK
jgi:hypothetical protein